MAYEYRIRVTACLVTVTLGCLAVHAVAQDAVTPADAVAKFAALVDGEMNLHMRLRLDLVTDGVVQDVPEQELWIRDRDGAGKESSLSAATASESWSDLTPDGRWLAFASDQTGSSEVYLRRLDGSGGALRVSSAGGMQPRWRSDGRELFYVDGSGRLMAVPLGPLDLPSPGAPVLLFDAQLEDGQYDVTADGQRFVVNSPLATESLPISVDLDWRQRLPPEAP